jgi:hypothetical protein
VPRARTIRQKSRFEEPPIIVEIADLEPAGSR